MNYVHFMLIKDEISWVKSYWFKTRSSPSSQKSLNY